MSRHDYETLRLIRRAKDGDQRAFDRLLNDLEGDLKKIATRFYILGSDKEDVIQEGRIGVWKAIVDFNPEGGMAFRNFAINLCVKRHIITQISQAKRKKYGPQNNAVSIDAPITSQGDEDSEQTVADFIPDPCSDMLADIILKEEFDQNAQALRHLLTELEAAIFEEYSAQESYKEIADALGSKSKCIDNGLMRIRKKAAGIYADYLAAAQKEKED